MPAKSYPILSAALVAATALSACNPEDGPYDPRVVTERTTEVAAVADGNNAFALDVYAQVAEEGENLFFSPFSISAALGMTYAGARGDTATQMHDVLQVGLADDAFHSTFGELMRDLSGEHPGRGYELSVANKLFGQAGYPWQADFLTITSDDYDAPLEDTDYVADPEGSRMAINEWVAEMTRDKIDELLKPGTITVDTRLVLANAIYFKADWASQFDPADTTDGSFTTEDGTEVTVPLMSQSGDFELAGDGEVSVVRLPYQDDEVSMLVVLPHDVDGLADVEADLSVERIDGWVADLWEQEADVVIPSFEMRSELGLNQVLADMGMPDAFDCTLADFSGIAELIEGPLCITDVVHEAYVKVDEEGTEAAAATGVVVGLESASPAFIADHPFLYLIRDDLTGSILFMGRVADPS